MLRRITDPAVLATTVAGTPNFAMTPANADLRGVRRVDVDVLGDAHGTMWAFPPVETTVRTGDALVLAESPAAFLDGEREDALREVARGLLSSFGYVGAGVVTFLIRSEKR
ncbi:MAG: hypothetical protein V9E81_05260 [Marmoricola sp.]